MLGTPPHKTPPRVIAFCMFATLACAEVALATPTDIGSVYGSNAQGSSFADYPRPGNEIAAIRIRGGNKVDAVQFTYRAANGVLFAAARHGGGGGDERTYIFQPGEFLTGIYGYAGDVITCLGFTTTRTSYQTHGNCSGVSFSIRAPHGFRVRGIYGRSGDLLDGIGLYADQ